MHHLIFEGAELAGKSWLMSEIYKHLEPKYNKSGFVLDGCHWFNSDNGVFGTEHGRGVIDGYLKIFEELKNNNIIVEKFHLSDKIYNRLHRQQELDYSDIEKSLLALNFKIILITLPEDKKKLEGRIKDRLNLYPHYKNIQKHPDWYIAQQQEYKKENLKSLLPSLVINTDVLPDKTLVKKILGWIKE